MIRRRSSRWLAENWLFSMIGVGIHSNLMYTSNYFPIHLSSHDRNFEIPRAHLQTCGNTTAIFHVWKTIDLPIFISFTSIPYTWSSALRSIKSVWFSCTEIMYLRLLKVGRCWSLLIAVDRIHSSGGLLLLMRNEQNQFCSKYVFWVLLLGNVSITRVIYLSKILCFGFFRFQLLIPNNSAQCHNKEDLLIQQGAGSTLFFQGCFFLWASFNANSISHDRSRESWFF